MPGLSVDRVVPKKSLPPLLEITVPIFLNGELGEKRRKSETTITMIERRFRFEYA
jgi:hypothetical protein